MTTRAHDGFGSRRSGSWRAAHVRALLETVDDLAQLVPLKLNAGLVLGSGVFDGQTLCLGFAGATVTRIVLTPASLGRHPRAEFGDEGAGCGTCNESAQIRDGTDANRAQLEPCGKLVEQALRLFAIAAQKQARRLPLGGQHLLGENQFTTTARVGGNRPVRGVLWL